MTNFLWAIRALFPLEQHDRLLAVTTIGFDIAALEVFVPLISAPAVARAAVIGRQDSEGGKQLVGYIGPADSETVDPALLRSYLSRRSYSQACDCCCCAGLGPASLQAYE